MMMLVRLMQLKCLPGQTFGARLISGALTSNDVEDSKTSRLRVIVVQVTTTIISKG